MRNNAPSVIFRNNNNINLILARPKVLEAAAEAVEAKAKEGNQRHQNVRKTNDREIDFYKTTRE